MTPSDEAAGDEDKVDAGAADVEAVGGENGGQRQGVDEEIAQGGGAGVERLRCCPEKDDSGGEVGVQCNDVRGDVAGAAGRIEGVGDGFKKDEEKADEPQSYAFLRVAAAQEVKDGQERGHGGQIGQELVVHPRSARLERAGFVAMIRVPVEMLIIEQKR